MFLCATLHFFQLSQINCQSKNINNERQGRHFCIRDGHWWYVQKFVLIVFPRCWQICHYHSKNQQQVCDTIEIINIHLLDVPIIFGMINNNADVDVVDPTIWDSFLTTIEITGKKFKVYKFNKIITNICEVPFKTLRVKMNLFRCDHNGLMGHRGLCWYTI